MKTRKLILLSGIALLLVIYLVQFFGGQRDSVRIISLDAIPDTVVINPDAENTVKLVRSGEKWSIDPAGYPADPDKVKDILEAFNALKVLETVSSSGQKARFELDEESRIVAKAYAGENLLRTLNIGKAAGGSQSYVSIDDKNEVLLVSENLKTIFDQSANDLRDRLVYKLSVPEVRGVKVAGDFNWEMRLEGEPARWVRTDDTSRSLDQEKVSSWIAALDQVRAIAFPEEGVSLDIDQDNLLGTFNFALADRQISLRIGKKGDDGRYPCISSESKWPFYLSAYIAERMLKNPAELESQ